MCTVFSVLLFFPGQFEWFLTLIMQACFTVTGAGLWLLKNVSVKYPGRTRNPLRVHPFWNVYIVSASFINQCLHIMCIMIAHVLPASAVTSSLATCGFVSISKYFDGLVQEKRNSIANALELRISFTNPSICYLQIYMTYGSGIMAMYHVWSPGYGFYLSWCIRFARRFFVSVLTVMDLTNKLEYTDKDIWSRTGPPFAKQILTEAALTYRHGQIIAC